MGKVVSPNNASGNEIAPKTGKKSFKAILKRYWYWFMTIPLLVVVSVVWLYFIGVFDNVNAIVIKSSTPQDINMSVDSMFHISVTSDSGLDPVYTSAHPEVAEVTDDGLIIAREEGTTVVTATFGKKHYDIAVTVSSLAVTWYLTSGDKFTIDDVYASFPTTAASLSSFQMKRNDYLDISPQDSTTGKTVYKVLDNIPSGGVDPIFVHVFSSSETDPDKTMRKGVLTIYVVPTQEEKESKTEAYNKSLAIDETPLTWPADQVDEEITFSCNSHYELRPKVTVPGFVYFFLETEFDPEFPLKMDQAGNFTISAAFEDTTKVFYITAVTDNKEAYRYKCRVVPPSTPITLSVGQTMYLDDYTDSFPADKIVQFSPSSRKLSPVTDEMGDLIGYKAMATTETPVYINCSSYEDKGFVTFRFDVSINNDPFEEEKNAEE